jgi:hypothetical protein
MDTHTHGPEPRLRHDPTGDQRREQQGCEGRIDRSPREGQLHGDGLGRGRRHGVGDLRSALRIVLPRGQDARRLLCDRLERKLGECELRGQSEEAVAVGCRLGRSVLDPASEARDDLCDALRVRCALSDVALEPAHRRPTVLLARNAIRTRRNFGRPPPRN